MISVYYRLYTTYTLDGFLFDLDQSNVCRDIQKIESLIRKCLTLPQKLYNKTKKRLQTPQKKLNDTFQAFLLLSILQNNQFQDLSIIKEKRYSIQAKREGTW
jgi:hypothetical protein